jgi:hypothetical protein
MTKSKAKFKLGEDVNIGNNSLYHGQIIMRFFSPTENVYLYNVNHEWFTEQSLSKIR